MWDKCVLVVLTVVSFAVADQWAVYKCAVALVIIHPTQPVLVEFSRSTLRITSQCALILSWSVGCDSIIPPARVRHGPA